MTLFHHRGSKFIVCLAKPSYHLFSAGVLLLWALAMLLSPKPAAAQAAWPSAVHQAEISTHLQAQLAGAEEPVSFLVILEEQLDPQAWAAAQAINASSRKERAHSLYKYLTEVAQRSQAPLRAWLDARGIPYRPYYIVNMIEVQGDVALAQALRPRTEVNRLAANPLLSQIESVVATSVSVPSVWPQTSVLPEVPSTPDLPYGLTYTQANEVWEMGFKGEGIVIASQDTGVQWDHPALKKQYRGWDEAAGSASHAYNWYDAWETYESNACPANSQDPCDDHGHGTHTVGTLVGDATDDGRTVMGMAPSAQWMGCRNMLRGVGTPASYTACFEFFLAPYPQGGDPFTDGRPEFAPHIINNSWGCPPNEGCDVNSLRQVVETARAAGQLVVASAGNGGNGSTCHSVNQPIGMHDAVFSVGAHNVAGSIASFSSRGPVTIDGSNRLKPDISAPGVDVLSTYPQNSYTRLSGTSMASPHVAGATALLWSAAPDLLGQIDRTEQVLIKSATPVPFNECGESPDPIVPNATYGYGRLDVRQAVEMALHPWQVGVQVTDVDGRPISGAQIELVDQLTGYAYSENTRFNGIARFTSMYGGIYACRILSPVADAQNADVMIAPLNGAGTLDQPQIDACTITNTTQERLYLPVVISS